MRGYALPGLVLALLFTLAVSGCTTPVQTGNGVVIEEFAPAFSQEVYSGEPVTFLLKFKNFGSVEATKVHAELLGLDEDWAAASANIKDNVIVNGEVLPREERCRYTGSGFSLKPPDLFYGTEGEVGTCTWKYNVPDIPAAMNPTYDITARVFYTYRTDLVKSFTLASTGELLNLKEQGRSIPTSTVSSTRSPITIVADSQSPIRFWEEEGSVTFPLKITFSNSGGGMVCLRDRCKKSSPGGHKWNQLEYSIEPLGEGIRVDCFGHEKTLEVWPNRDNTIVCDIEASGLSQITGYEERLLQISAVYSYFADAKSSVAIL